MTRRCDSGKQRLNEWLKQRAGQWDRKELVRCYVAVPSAQSRVVGFYAICSHHVSHELLPADQAKGLPKMDVPVVLLAQSRHERLNFESIRAFQRVAHRVSDAIPIILETPVRADEVEDEIASAEEVFSGAHRLPKQPSSIRPAKGPRTTCKHVVDSRR